MFDQVIIFAAGGLIERIGAGGFAIDLVQPLADVARRLRGRFGFRGPHASLMLRVSVHAAAGSVNNRCALIAAGGQQRIHPGSQFADATHGIDAMMRIPHVADDDRQILGATVRFWSGVPTVKTGAISVWYRNCTLYESVG